MLNKEQAHKVTPLVNNKRAWEGLEEYLISKTVSINLNN